MQHFKRLLVGVAVLAVVAIAAVSAFAAGGNAVVKVGPSNLGRVLVDAHEKPFEMLHMNLPSFRATLRSVASLLISKRYVAFYNSRHVRHRSDVKPTQ